MEATIVAGSASLLNNGALSQLLECSVCLSLLCEPISISCGHTFCRICLVKSLRRHKKQCPSCREICHTSAENASENVVIKSLAIAADPILYAQKVAEYASERASWNALFPIFFYNQTLFPSNLLKLHLFEPRYKLMMTRIVDASRAFAYVPKHPITTGDLALVAELRNAEFLADGRCLVEASLCKRSRIVEFYQEDGTQGLFYCSLERIFDDPVLPENAEALAALKAHAIQLTERLLADTYARRAVEEQFGRMPSETEAFSMWFASVSPLSEEEKTLALQSRITADRLQMCSQRLQNYLDRRRGGTFPVVNAIGSTLASTLSALLGTGTPVVMAPDNTTAAASADTNTSNTGSEVRAATSRHLSGRTRASVAGATGAESARSDSDDDIPDLVSDSSTSSYYDYRDSESGSDTDSNDMLSISGSEVEDDDEEGGPAAHSEIDAGPAGAIGAAMEGE